MAELKPCPFCGASCLCVDVTADGWVIVCNGCLAQSPAGETPLDAETKWNRRAEDGK